MPLTVLIVDDHADFRRAARALLGAEGFSVLGEAADGASAIAETARLRPDVVLLDIHLPDIDGFAVAEDLARSPHAPMVVLVSSREPAAFGRRIARSSARGFIAKTELTADALHALVG